MQGTIYKRVKHQCAKGQPQWVRLPNPLPKTFPCSTCGSNLTKGKETRYDCSWWAGGKKRSKTFATKHVASRFLTGVVKDSQDGTYQQTRAVAMSVVFDAWEKHLSVKQQQVRWTPSFGPKSGLAKVEPAGSVLVVVVSCELGCRPGPGTRNRPTPVRGDGVQVAAGAPRSGVGAERRTWRRSSTPAPGAEAARALMRRGTSTSSHRTRPASDSPTTYAVARHCRSGSSARFPRAPRSANHRGAGRSPHT